MKNMQSMAAPDDLDDYLRGDSALSRQYRRESAPAPPHALDRRVLGLAREAHGTAQRLTPCLAPLAFAASVLLSVALVLAIAAPLGDLFESLLKRDMDVKDTGTLLGGHGGMLDRIDALLLAAPAAYFAILAFTS